MVVTGLCSGYSTKGNGYDGGNGMSGHPLPYDKDEKERERLLSKV